MNEIPDGAWVFIVVIIFGTIASTLYQLGITPEHIAQFIGAK